MGTLKNSGVEIPDTVIDGVHRISLPYVVKTTKRQCKSIIIRFSTIRHRKIIFRAKKNTRSPLRLKIDLTKKRHNLLVSENKYDININSLKFCYADIKCRLKIRWEDESISDTFFYSLAELKNHINPDE